MVSRTRMRIRKSKNLLSILLALSFMATFFPFGAHTEASAKGSVCSHEWDEGVITREAACVTPGIKEFTCTLCGETKEEMVQALGHSFGGWQPMNKNWHRHVCIRCGMTHDGYHIWDAGTVTKEPTCATPGENTFCCIVCGGTKTELIATVPDAHMWDEGTVTTEASCNDAGIMTYTCIECGATKTEAIDAFGSHDFSDWQMLNEKWHGRVCSRCGAHIEGYHRWGDGIVTQEPTCATPGARTFLCVFCGGTKTEPIATVPDAHTWDDGTVTTEASCTAAGIMTFTCVACGATKTEGIESFGGHVFGDWQMVNETWHRRVCSRCGAHTDGYHKWDNGVVEKEPAYTRPGTRLYSCELCGGTKTEELPMLEPAADELVIAAASVGAKPGDTVTVPVEIIHPVPACYLSLYVQYDDALTLIDAENGGLFSGYEQGGNLVFDAAGNVEQTGTLVTLRFKVDCAAAQGSYEVHLTGKAFDREENEVTVTAEPGAIAVEECLLGDVNGDSVVDGRDLVRLRKYLAALDETMGESSITVSSGADVTGDSTVDGRDLIRLRKYLANLDETTGLSAVTLGA